MLSTEIRKSQLFCLFCRPSFMNFIGNYFFLFVIPFSIASTSKLIDSRPRSCAFTSTEVNGVCEYLESRLLLKLAMAMSSGILMFKPSKTCIAPNATKSSVIMTASGLGVIFNNYLPYLYPVSSSKLPINN